MALAEAGTSFLAGSWKAFGPRSRRFAFVATVGGAATAWTRGWRTAARWVVVWDLPLNGYPVMLQRYNRGRLAGRFGSS